ncbi:SHOCT domain-containing protein [Kitasatospora sp. NBC_01250]|uniref:SHOCT domain-containing protein n=1 Tax=Kitasatospora sp. NBC_01250 TaxID=2903571 RepID=UPI002E2ED566|nr:SHOCT domain-containing protein [Kitasatospora sp. NBC_01250]
MHTFATGLLAGDHWHGGPWFVIFPLLWLAFLVLVFVTLRRTLWRRGCYGGPVGSFGPAGRFGAAGPLQSPLAVLGERYARGEIDEDEYRARRAVLIERGPGDTGSDHT